MTTTDRTMGAIGYLVPEFPSQTHTFFWREIRALRNLGAEVRIVSTRRPSAEAGRHRFSDQARAETMYLHPPRPLRALRALLHDRPALARALAYLRSLDGTGPGRRLRLLALLVYAAGLADWARREGLSHLHVHSCADAAHVAALAHRLSGLPFSATLHGNLSIYGGHHTQKLRDARFVAAVTQPLLDELRTQAGIDEARLLYCPMGIDAGHFVPPPQPQTEPPLRCIMVARINLTKGHPVALQALRILLDEGLDVRLDILGCGPEEHLTTAALRELRLAQHVRLHGTRSEDEVLAALQASHVLLLPSFGHGEAAPVAVMEAMACGVVPVASIVGGTPQMIEDGVTGFLVPQRDVQALADRMRLLYGNPALRQRMAHAARRKAVADFSAAQSAERLLRRIRQA